jgi:hypothetical protein
MACVRADSPSSRRHGLLDLARCLIPSPSNAVPVRGGSLPQALQRPSIGFSRAGLEGRIPTTGSTVPVPEQGSAPALSRPRRRRPAGPSAATAAGLDEIPMPSCTTPTPCTVSPTPPSSSISVAGPATRHRIDHDSLGNIHRTCVVHNPLKVRSRGRDGDCSPPPAQIPACAANAPGSHLGS